MGQKCQFVDIDVVGVVCYACLFHKKINSHIFTTKVNQAL